MGMGAYDESEQNRMEEQKGDIEASNDEDDIERHEGEIKFNTDQVTTEDLMENFKSQN